MDFDVEGGALPNTAANTRRAQAIAALQKSHPDLDVSFTLPVMPEGLTQDGVNLLADAKANGVRVDAVNIMAMDYGPAYSDDMGTYAEQAATATQAQLKDVLGLGEEEAWKAVAVTPMIGVNDVVTEIFTVEDATQLVEFAKAKGLAGCRCGPAPATSSAPRARSRQPTPPAARSSRRSSPSRRPSRPTTEPSRDSFASHLKRTGNACPGRTLPPPGRGTVRPATDLQRPAWQDPDTHERGAALPRDRRAPPPNLAPRPSGPPRAGQTPSGSGSSPALAAFAYQSALDFGVRFWLA